MDKETWAKLSPGEKEEYINAMMDGVKSGQLIHKNPEETDPETPPAFVIAPIIGSSRPTGRNDKCPCGSGKKYKRCCSKEIR